MTICITSPRLPPFNRDAVHKNLLLRSGVELASKRRAGVEASRHRGIEASRRPRCNNAWGRALWHRGRIEASRPASRPASSLHRVYIESTSSLTSSLHRVYIESGVESGIELIEARAQFPGCHPGTTATSLSQQQLQQRRSERVGWQQPPS